MKKWDVASVAGALLFAAIFCLPVDGQNNSTLGEQATPQPANPVAKAFALSFSNDGQCITVPNSSALAITGPLTMEVWVQADEGLQAHYYNYIISKNMGDTGYGLRVKGEAGHKVLGGVAVSVPFNVKHGEWTHIADVLDGTEEKLYLNGGLAGHQPYIKPLKVNDLSLWIGSCPFGRADNWRGALGEVRIWAVARTQEEIRATLNRRLRGDEAGLRSCWPMAEGKGQKIKDLTGHTSPGQLGSKPEANPDSPVWVPRIDFDRAKIAPTEAGVSASGTVTSPVVEASVKETTPIGNSLWSGFRGIKWGARIEDIPGLMLMEDDGNSKFYRRDSDKLAIGGAQVEKITYGFYKGRFSNVLIRADGYMNWTKLHDAVFANYGEGKQTNRYIERWDWGTPFPGVEDVGMSLEYNTIAKQSDLWMSYRPISVQKKMDDEQAAKKAVKDF